MAARARWILRHRSPQAFVAFLLISAILLLAPRAALAQFSEEGGKLIGALAVGKAFQGNSVALSADGETAIVGGPTDNSGAGAAWVFTRGKNEVWTQQGRKLIGDGAVGKASQGFSVAISADGATAIVGGYTDNSSVGAAWVFTRASDGAWTQQGDKLIGAGAAGTARQGFSVALSADGDTALVGGPEDDFFAGAAWVFTRSGEGVWSQQGDKLIGGGAVDGCCGAEQGYAVALSADSDTAIVGGPGDNSTLGAAWVFTRSGAVWTQQGGKLIGSGAVGVAEQGYSVALSADGGTAIMGGSEDDTNRGAAWVFLRSAGVWTQQGSKLVGAGAANNAQQGSSVTLAADGDTAISGGYADKSFTGAAWVFTRADDGVWSQQGDKLVGKAAAKNSAQGWSVSLSGDGDAVFVGAPFFDKNAGAAWVFLQPLQVAPYTDVAASGTEGGPFTPKSSRYTLSARTGSVKYAITGVPAWLTASTTEGTATKSGKTVTFKINAAADALAPGAYVGVIEFEKAGKLQKSIARTVTLTVNAK